MDLDRLIAFYNSFAPDSVARFPEFYSADAWFKDPFNEVRGIPAIQRIFSHMFKQVDEPRFVVVDKIADAGVEALATGRATEGDHVPVAQAGVAFEVDARCQFGLGAGVDNGFLGQPFQGGAGADLEFQLLIGRPGGAVPLGGAGAGQLGPGVRAEAGIDVQAITTGNPARRVDDDVLAHLGTFAVQVLLHPQWTLVAAQRGTRGLAVTAIAQLQLGMPAGGE